ncbi:chromate transporter [Mycoplasma sp. Ms02]|uniref:chromate transporter n=1 Tax=Mycoplasma sp. Ms02 TaxID=353851 RepID=UPI001C8AF754|nr:chromate transporter [Mycoplasma sp. Ms02]QZE12343.1 chromate transporter [Mycoplasma sp. Ms02]
MIFLALLIVPLISLSVFGGGQVFIPIFSWLWNLVGGNFNEEAINQVLSISNMTPGVVSTKFAFFTGYLAANQWYLGIIFALVFFLIFAIPSIIVMSLTMKFVTTFEKNALMKRVINIIKPVIVGVILALIIQLFISNILPAFSFNKGVDNYLGLSTSELSKFFSLGSWRMWALIAFAIISIPLFLFLMNKKVKLFYLFLISVSLSFIIFQPWLS